MTSDRRTLDWRPFGWSTPRLLLVGLLGVLCILLVVFATTSTAGFNPYNANWDGTGEFRELADSRGELTVTTAVEQYESSDPNTTAGFVFAPDREYNTADAAIIRQFVTEGGTLVVADNYGPNGNELLSEVGATARFDGQILRDERNNFRAPALPIATNISSHRLVSGVDSLTLNYGTTIKPGEATPIANSSAFSYLSQNESMTPTEDTELRQYPVVTVESVGKGTVVVIGDPSLFINSMLGQTDNRQFATTLIDQRTRILLDQSHTSALPPLVAATLAVRSSPSTAAGFITVLVGLIAAVGRYGWPEDLPWRQWVDRIWSTVDPTAAQSRSAVGLESESPRADPAALKAQLRQRHPDWDDDRLDRVIAGVLSHHTNGSDNE